MVKLKQYCLSPKKKPSKLKCVKARNYKEASKKLKVSQYELRTYGFIK